VRVGVRALRDSLSSHLQSVRAGKSVVITDHGRVIARLVPAGEDALTRLIAEGLLREPAEARTELPPPMVTTSGVSDLIHGQRA
jgi:prevent-host-death family protein